MSHARALARLPLGRLASQLGLPDSTAARARLALLLVFADAVVGAAPLLWTSDAFGYEWSVGARLCALHRLLPRAARQRLFAHAVGGSQLPGAHTPTVTLDRARAADARARAADEPAAAMRASVLCQLQTQLGPSLGRSLRQRTRPFRVRLAGEASDDLGGPFREAIAEACLEISAPTAGLLAPTPNARDGAGAHRDCAQPAPAARSARELGAWHLVGQLVGSALRHDEPLVDLLLAPPVWRALRAGSLVRAAPEPAAALPRA
jgi:hypothetical protein